MKIKLFLPFLMIGVPAFAQFHTVSLKRNLYCIETTGQIQPSKDRFPEAPVGATDDDLSKEGTSSFFSQDKAYENSPALDFNEENSSLTSDSLRTLYTKQYMSVSLPLSEIYITSPYGYRTDPFNGKRRMHEGIDLRADSSEAYAMFEGIVKKVGHDRRSGNYITLQHGDFTICYCHLSAIGVHAGDIVHPGEVIAFTGNTGRSTGPHLHLSSRFKNRPIDCALLLDFIINTRKLSMDQLYLLSKADDH